MERKPFTTGCSLAQGTGLAQPQGRAFDKASMKMSYARLELAIKTELKRRVL